MKLHYLKKFISALAVSAVMVQNTAFPAFAGELLGQSDFTEGIGLPWRICESMTGKMDFTIEDGTYNITIINTGGLSNGGEDRWDCQFRHRNLTFVAGHTYR